MAACIIFYQFNLPYQPGNKLKGPCILREDHKKGISSQNEWWDLSAGGRCFCKAIDEVLISPCKVMDVLYFRSIRNSIWKCFLCNIFSRDPTSRAILSPQSSVDTVAWSFIWRNIKRGEKKTWDMIFFIRIIQMPNCYQKRLRNWILNGGGNNVMVLHP